MLVALLPLPERLGWLIGIFRDTMAAEACKRRLGPLSIALWTRVRRLERRFSSLHAMWKAGRLPRARVRTSPSARPSAPHGEGAGGGGVAGVLPRAVRWMQRMLPLSAGTLASGVGPLVLDCPETRAFVAECPQAGRVLRPLCRLAGLPAPDWLALPRRKRSSSRPSPGEGDVRRRRTAREVARAAIDRAERTGKPIDPGKISAVAYGYVLHWPRDGNCPPPEIGYGGRSFARLPKDYVRPKDWE